LSGIFTGRFVVALFILSALCGMGNAFAQQTPFSKPDSVIIKVPYNYKPTNNSLSRKGIFDSDPPGLTRTIEYNAATNSYVMYERVGNLLYRPPVYLSFSEYLKLKQQEEKRSYFKKLTDNYAYQSQQPGFLPQIKVRSQTFAKIFGSNVIDIRPQGSAEAIMSGQINNNQNPLFNTRQRKQFNFNFDQRIQLNVTGNIGDKLKIATNYNTDAQFQFDNQFKLEYKGHADEIIQEIQAGTVSMPLPTTLITGTQALFGIRTKLKFGRLGVTGVFSQQRSQSRTLTISNGSQQGEINLVASDYEANKHYFLAQYFRDNYNKSLANIPLIGSGINITRIEVWVTNRTNSTTDSRDVLGLLDLGENNPYTTPLVQGGAGYSPLPSGFLGPIAAQQSNSLLQNLPAGARQTNDPTNALANYFAASGGTDNYAKLTYARKLTINKEFTLQTQLGYISLNYPLNNDEVLAVAFQYTYNGVQYQVGEFSTDIPVDPAQPKVLYLKLLKNTLLKTKLPTWKLMMKNIYSLNAYQISPQNFKLRVARLNDKTSVEKPVMEEGQNTTGKLWLQLTGLDNLSQQNEKRPDGYFDFLEGVTIDSQNGRIVFPVLEPFGSDLAARFAPGETDLRRRYVYQQLYDSTKTVAQQFFPQLNRYAIKGTYSSQGGGGSYQLNATNIPQGSVVVSAGATKLVEGTDYTIDYNSGRLNIINGALLSSGQPITVNLENNELFGVQQKSLYGARFDYRMNNKLAFGGTIMHLTEQPISQNEAVGSESISNTIWGLDVNYSSESRFLTRMVDKLPFLETKAPSSVNFSGEFAQLLPGSPGVLSYAGARNGTSYLDDFENSQSVIDVKAANAWQLSGTPRLFPESGLFNNLAYGYNRARLAFYNIDPIFYTSGSIPISRKQLSNHYVRQIFQTEVFPYKQSVTGQPLAVSTLDLAFYPTVRGPYNYATTGINPDGTLQNPRSRWGGIYRSIPITDFQSLNVQYIEFWMMDPFIYKQQSQGGDLYINLGSTSEDILKDGRKSLENGLPANGDYSTVDNTVWGRVTRTQPVINAFDSNPTSRALQDIGLDGLNDADERINFANVIQQIQGQLSGPAAASFNNDPSSDDFQYYLGANQDQAGADILTRYSRFNGNESNSKTAEQSQAELGLPTSASTALPDGEDIDRDNNMSQDDQYFQYKISMRPNDLVVGQNFVNDKLISQVKLADGTTQPVTWYQIRIPVTSYQSTVGGIQDFKAIRYMRMFMTNFADTAVLRFATMELVRGDWRAFNTENNPANVIADVALNNPPLDNSTYAVQTVNIEENGKRVPIPYVVPPGIQRQRDYNNLQINTQLNEQSLSQTVTNLTDGYSRASFKTFYNDLRRYNHLQMFIHAEAAPQNTLRDGELSAFVRLGTDYQNNYYEYEIPLVVTQPGTTNASSIWPVENELDIDLSILTDAKLARNNAKYMGLPWPVNRPFTYSNGRNRITIMGVPDMSRLRTIMLGVRNPFKGNSAAGIDDGLPKAGIVWFDELRLTDFKTKQGWAAMARFDAKLADFADVTISGSKSTAGFGALDSKLQERSLNDNQAYDISASMDIGRFFPAKSGIKIPTYVNLSSQVSTPMYDPGQPDILLKQSLDAAKTEQQRDSIKTISEDYTKRRSINFTNVHKERTNPTASVHLWDIENFNVSYAFTEYLHRDFITENNVERTYTGALAYNYANQPKYISPLAKVIKANPLALLRDINFSPMPSRLNFSMNFNRFYAENTLRNTDRDNPTSIPTNFNKNFNIVRIYGIGWSLTKSLTMDLDATNLSVVDEPYGRITGLKRDTLWENIKKLGRTTNYNHTLNINYTTPINKIPGLDWTTMIVHYTTHFDWLAQPLFGLRDPNLNVGNSIQNARTIQLTPSLDFTRLYSKFSAYRDRQKPDFEGKGIGNFFMGALFSIKNMSGTYTRTEGTFLPGYLPQSNIFGQDFTYDAPGLGFLLGSQADIREKAIANGWLSKNTLQNQLYARTFNEDLRLKAMIEPIRDLRIQLSAFKSQNRNYQTNFKYSDMTGGFENMAAITAGDYNISFFSLATAFSSPSGIENVSAPFLKFLDNRAGISKRLGAQNPNSAGTNAAGYADGYGPNAQNVLVPAFLAAITGKDPSGANLNQFPSIPIPNWQITYGGLSRVPFMQEIFDSFDLRHGYQSTYMVSNYSSLLQYQESGGNATSRDVNNDFLPRYQFGQISIYEQFVPLLGADMRFKNNVTANFEYRQSRILSLSMANSQLTQQNEKVIQFGMGYKTRNFRFPFGLFRNTILKNDLNFKLDFALRDNKTLIYRADVQAAQISSGAQNITYRPSIDYSISQRFNMTLFYDSNLTRPYTSQSFNTSFTNFGVNLKLLLQ